MCVSAVGHDELGLRSLNERALPTMRAGQVRTISNDVILVCSQQLGWPLNCGPSCASMRQIPNWCGPSMFLMGLRFSGS